MWWSFVLSEPHLAMGPHRLAIVCKPFLSVCHSNQTGTSCLTMTGSSNENQKSWISQHSLGKTDCKYMQIVWIVRSVVWAIPSMVDAFAHSSEGSQRLQPWHALTLSAPNCRFRHLSFRLGKCKRWEAEEKPNRKNYNEPHETNRKNYNYTD